MGRKSKLNLVKVSTECEIIGGGNTYTFKRDSKIATVTAGYADGVPRLLSNKGRVMVGGKYANIVGEYKKNNGDNIDVNPKVVLCAKLSFSTIP